MRLFCALAPTQRQGYARALQAFHDFFRCPASSILAIQPDLFRLESPDDILFPSLLLRSIRLQAGGESIEHRPETSAVPSPLQSSARSSGFRGPVADQATFLLSQNVQS